MFAQTCTIFCFTQNPQSGGITLYPRVLTGVGWYAKTNTAIRAYRNAALQASDSVVLNIPCKVSSEETYVSPEDFIAAADKSALWTLQTEAVVLLGDWSQSVLEEVFPAGMPTTADLLGKVPAGKAFTIRGMELLPVGTDFVRHWRVWGR